VADLAIALSVYLHDPNDPSNAQQLKDALLAASNDVAASQSIASTRKALVDSERPVAALWLLDCELAALRDDQAPRRVALLLEKAAILDEELFDAQGAQQALRAAGALRPNDETVKEQLGELELAAANWQQFATKFAQEAASATDRPLAQSLSLSAAATILRFAPKDAPQATVVEAHLRRAIELDPSTRRPWFHLSRLLANTGRWNDLAQALTQRAEGLTKREDLAPVLLALAHVQRDQLAQITAASSTARRALSLSPGHREIVRTVAHELQASGDWAGLTEMYLAALKERRGFDDSTHVDWLLQLGDVLWQRLGDLDRAEECFRRVRRVLPSNLRSVEFYRAFYAARGDSGKLIALLRQVERSLVEPGAPIESQDETSGRVRALGLEIAELSEAQLGNPEKAIDAWKQLLRSDPASAEARAALYRLYRRTEKWNALIDLVKEDVERIAVDQISSKVERMFEMIEIYRDRLRLDVMVIATYVAILKLDPDNQRANAELAEKYRGLGRWNDLIALLLVKAENPNVPISERVSIFFEVADLWSDRFGNLGNAIRPLERIVELAPQQSPSDAYDQAIARLKDIYSRRRQWRALVDLLGKEEQRVTGAAAWAKRFEMARLAAERVGDNRLAIEILNQLLASLSPTPTGDAAGAQAEALAALVGLYERERRFLAVIEIIERQASKTSDVKAQVVHLEKIAGIWSERQNAPAQAALVWRRVLAIEPEHSKALRILRELYITASDPDGLTALYLQLNQPDELVDAMLGLSERQEQPQQRLKLVERAALLASQRVEVVAPAKRSEAVDRLIRAWERALQIDPEHLQAAQALAPLYSNAEKWPRLLAMLELQLKAAPLPAQKLAFYDEIAHLCERRLGSKAVALGWALHALPVAPTDAERRANLVRLATEPAQIKDVAAALGTQAQRIELPVEARVKMWREAAALWQRLGDFGQAREAIVNVRSASPDDRDAEVELEALLVASCDWPALVALWRQRETSIDAAKRASLRFDIAETLEHKVGDIDAAIVGYLSVTELNNADDVITTKALAGLERLYTARGQWPTLLGVLQSQLALEQRRSGRAALQLRMGELARDHMGDAGLAFVHYWNALEQAEAASVQRSTAFRALASYLHAPLLALLELEKQRQLATLVHLETDDKLRTSNDLAAALEIIRVDPSRQREVQAIDQQLLAVYHQDLGDHGAAWQPALRLLAANPGNGANRSTLFALAGQLGRDGELGASLTTAATELAKRDPHAAELYDLWIEIGNFATDRLENRPAAENAWRHALLLRPQDSFAHRALATLLRQTGRYQDLVDSLRGYAERCDDPRARLEAIRELAVLSEDNLHDAQQAIAANRAVLEAVPDDKTAFVALDRLYTATSAWSLLVELLASHGVRHTDAATWNSINDRVALDGRRASLLANQLAQPLQAVELLSELWASHPTSPFIVDGAAVKQIDALTTSDNAAARLQAAQLLAPHFEQAGAWDHALRCLRIEYDVRSVASLPGGELLDHEAVAMQLHIGELEEQRRGDAAAALAAYDQVLKLEPSHAAARQAVRRICMSQGDLKHLAATLESIEKALAASPDIAVQCELNNEIAEFAVQRGDAQRAITAYQRMLTLDGSNSTVALPAQRALVPLYEQSEQWQPMTVALHGAAQLETDAIAGRQLLQRAAEIEELKLQQLAVATATWREVRSEAESSNAQQARDHALLSLDRLLVLQAAWPAVSDVLSERCIHAANDGRIAELIALRLRLAELHESKLAEPDQAIAHYLDILDYEPRHPGALHALERLYRSQGRHADLLENLEQQEAAGIADPVVVQTMMAHLLGTELSRPPDALERWSNVLRLDPNHPQARRAVTDALDDVDLRAMAFAMLVPLYQQHRETAALCGLYERSVTWSDDPQEKIAALSNVVSLREQSGDLRGAFSAQQQLLRFAATQPQLRAAVADMERLADRVDGHGELIAAYQATLPDVLDAEVARQLHLDVADLSRALRKDTTTAITHYTLVLDANPDDRRALAALESIYRDNDDSDRLAETLLRQVNLPGVDDEEKVAGYAEAAQLQAKSGRDDDAIATWDAVLEIAPQYQPAFIALEALHIKQQRWHDVLDIYERRLGYTTSVSEAVALRLRMAEVCEHNVGDLPAAIDNYEAALTNDPSSTVAAGALRRLLDHPDARLLAADALEPIFVAGHRWTDLAPVYMARLQAANDPDQRVYALRSLARLQEEQLEDFDQASDSYRLLFLEIPNDDEVREQLQRLASVTGNWDQVIRAYEEFLRDGAGEPALVREIAIALGVVYDRKKNDVDKAVLTYRRALLIEPEAGVIPTTAHLVVRLEEIYHAGRSYPLLVEVYDHVAQRSDSAARRNALAKRAEIQEQQLSDPTAAIESWREVLADVADATSTVSDNAVDPQWQRAASELERLYRSRNQLADVAELLESRLVRSDSPAAMADVRLALAQVQLDRHDSNAAIDQYEQVLTDQVGWERAVAKLEQLVVEAPVRERVIELLEPVYRRETWWQRLVVILAAKLEYVFDDEQKVATLFEIADLHYRRGGDHALARAALLDAWRVDVGNAVALRRLFDGARVDNAWPEIVSALVAGIPGGSDAIVRADLWQQLAHVQDTELGDVASAIASWRKAIAEQPEHVVALSALDRLLAMQQNYAELVPVVLRRAELADDAGVRAVLLHRAGAYCEENLRDPVQAIAAYREAVAVDPTDATALDALQRLYQATGQFRDLVDVIDRKLDIVSEVTERTRQADHGARIALHVVAAQTFEHKLNDRQRAISHWQAVIDLDGKHALALSELDRCYTTGKMWSELVEILDRRAVLTPVAVERAAIACRAAEITAVQRGDVESAVARYGAVLQIQPSHVAAKQALFALLDDADHAELAIPLLERWCRSEGDVKGLIAVLERKTRLHVDGEPSQRRDTWAQLAETHEVLANDSSGAFAVWATALNATPDDVELLGPLRRLAASAQLWPAFSSLLLQQLDRGLDSDIEYAYSMESGFVHEDRLSDLVTAEKQFERASRCGEPGPALTALERVLARSGRSEALAAVLARQADAAPTDAARAEFLFRRGDLLESILHQPKTAVDAYSDALLAEPQHRSARNALHRMLKAADWGSDDSVRRHIAEVVLPLWEADGNHGKVCEVLEAQQAATTDVAERRDILQRLIELREHELHDAGGALDAALGVHDLAAGDEHALSEVTRLGERTGAWRLVIERLDHAAVELRKLRQIDNAASLRLHSALGKIYSERLAQPELAIAAYGHAAHADPYSLVVVDEMVSLYRRQNDAAGLIRTLSARGKLVDDHAAKRAAFFEVADLCEVSGDNDGAVAAWQSAIAIDETDLDALQRLASVFTRLGKINDLKSTLLQSVRAVEDPAHEVQLRQRIAQICSQQHDIDGAIAQWHAIADVDPSNIEALRTLEKLYGDKQQWDTVRELKQRRVDASVLPSERVAVLSEIAELDENKRARLDDAIATWFAALEIQPRSDVALAGLDRLLRQSKRWHDLVEVLERNAEQCAAAGDDRGEIRSLATMADIWEGPLDNTEEAALVLEKILHRDAQSVAALSRLAKVYVRNRNFEGARQTIERAIDLGPTGHDAADCYVRLADIATATGESSQVAKAHLQRALQFDATHADAGAALEKIARHEQDNATLEPLLAARLARASEADKADLCLELANLAKLRAGHDVALGYLQQAVALRPTDAEATMALADAYVAVGQFGPAAPLLEQLANDAKAGKRLKDAARFRQRQGALLVRQGDLAAAQVAYEESFRVAPTDTTTMIGLGRLYVQTQAWEAARRIYQSMVLQTIEPAVAKELGATKPELYLSLGNIVLNMQQPDKAKAMFQRGLEFDSSNAALASALAKLG
jgi:golgin subfamily B member 1